MAYLGEGKLEEFLPNHPLRARASDLRNEASELVKRAIDEAQAGHDPGAPGFGEGGGSGQSDGNQARGINMSGSRQTASSGKMTGHTAMRLTDPESQKALARLKALMTDAGPDSPIYRSGLMMTPVRRLKPSIETSPTDTAGTKTSKVE